MGFLSSISLVWFQKPVFILFEVNWFIEWNRQEENAGRAEKGQFYDTAERGAVLGIRVSVWEYGGMRERVVRQDVGRKGKAVIISSFSP
ncbi:hypothetical protein U1Q18_049080 [Sarracenia purpurea var. burkii]